MTKTALREFVSRSTPFKRYKARNADRCCLLSCAQRIPAGAFAFKPVKNTGGYTMTARICDSCGQVLAKAEL